MDRSALKFCGRYFYALNFFFFFFLWPIDFFIFYFLLIFFFLCSGNCGRLFVL